MALKRIKYISRFSGVLSPSDIEQIVAVSQRNNQLAGITGVMATSGKLFYQVLEGPSEQVDGLLKKIRADPRHTDFVLLRVQEDVESRLFPSWSMQSIQLDEASALRLEPLRETLATMVELRLLSDKMAAVLDRALYNEMSTRS